MIYGGGDNPLAVSSADFRDMYEDNKVGLSCPFLPAASGLSALCTTWFNTEYSTCHSEATTVVHLIYVATVLLFWPFLCPLRCFVHHPGVLTL